MGNYLGELLDMFFLINMEFHHFYFYSDMLEAGSKSPYMKDVLVPEESILEEKLPTCRAIFFFFPRGNSRWLDYLFYFYFVTIFLFCSPSTDTLCWI